MFQTLLQVARGTRYGALRAPTEMNENWRRCGTQVGDLRYGKLLNQRVFINRDFRRIHHVEDYYF